MKENYIIRRGKKDKYEYFTLDENKIEDKNILNKIKKIYIAPAYTDVKIFLDKDILATGINNAGRKQYIYSTKMKELREIKKYKKLKIVAKNINNLKNKIQKDLNNHIFNKNKLIAILLKIMELCNFRNGNKRYEKLYGTYGLLTLHKKHISFKKNFVEIDFIGKKGMPNNCLIKNKNIQKIIKKVYNLSTTDDPYLFTIKDKDKTIKIFIKDINKYLNNYKITCKDLRMWNANIIFLKNLKNLKNKSSDNYNKKKLIRNAIKETAISLHHTAAICKSSYIYKKIIEDIENNDNIINKLLSNNKIDDILKEFLI
jgi:DNA topoisomerase-1